MANVMKVVSVGVALLCFCGFVNSESPLSCSAVFSDGSTQWVDMVEPCVFMVKEQIQREVNASMAYVAMGAYFSRDTVNRPGFAKMFFDSAKEERDHAIKLMDYLLMRGETLEDIKNLIVVSPPTNLEWKDGVKALKDALELEGNVTVAITSVIKECESPKTKGQKPGIGNKPGRKAKESFNDYHLVDYLTGVYLEEQYHSQRDLAGKMYTLGKMIENHGPLGEFLFDKKLCNGEVPAFG